ncbi:transposase, partial [Klebsiella variicola]
YVHHRQIKYRNNIIECDHGKLKRIINATLGFKSMKTAYATIKGIEVMRALRKGQAESFYFGHPQGEMRLVSRVFEISHLSITLKANSSITLQQCLFISLTSVDDGWRCLK